MRSVSKVTVLLAVVLCLLVVDWVTKELAWLYLRDGPVSVFPWFALQLAGNPHVMPGLLRDSFLVAWVVRCTLLGVMAVAMWRLRSHSPSRALALAIAFAGALGNTSDLALYGQVTDFLVVTTPFFSSNVFNVADLAISCGVAMLMVLELPRLFFGDEDTRSRPESAAR